MRFANKVALITGAGSGIGQGIAYALAAEGAAIAAAGRTLKKVEATAAEVARRGGKAIAIQCDVKDATALENAVKETVARLNEATHAAMETPAIKARFDAVGVVGVAPERRGPEYLAKYVVEEIARWEGPIKAAGLQVE